MQKKPKYSWNVVILSGNKQEEDVETRLGAADSRFQRILWAVNLLTDVMLFVGKLHSAQEEYEAEKKTWDDEKAELKTKIKAVEESYQLG